MPLKCGVLERDEEGEVMKSKERFSPDVQSELIKRNRCPKFGNEMKDKEGKKHTDVIQFLRDHPVAEKFIPYCDYSKKGDAMNVYFTGDADYSKRLNEKITLFISIDTGEVVGCRIKGIRDICEIS